LFSLVEIRGIGKSFPIKEFIDEIINYGKKH
jgi:hypothetical protein